MKTNAKEDAIQSIDGSHYTVRVQASPVDGKANDALVKLFADHFDVAQSRITIVSGFSSRKKIIEITQ